MSVLWVLLAGSVGALLVFGLGVAREWWRDERERRGLLRLLLAEIKHNAEVVRTISESGQPSLIGSPNIGLMKAQTWQDTQVRAAHLLPDKLFGEVYTYYSLLETWLTLLRFHGKGGEHAERWIRSLMAQTLGEEFPRTRDPWIWYRNHTVEAQDRARDRITLYLERSYIKNLFTRAARQPE